MQLAKLPDLTFAALDADSLHDEVLSTLEASLNRSIAAADPVNLLARSFELIILQQRALIDTAAKQNLLAYATGDYLDHIGALVGVERLSPVSAVTTLQLTLSAPRNITTIIDAGLRVTAGDDHYFATDSDVIFSANQTTATIGATCLETGDIGNGYAVGELKEIVDPRPFLQSVKNITASEGGGDRESDDRFRQRIHASIERFSTAGPRGAYDYWAKTASEEISDVSIWSSAPGRVDICVLLSNGVIPDRELLDKVYSICNDETRRPLTDLVEVHSPRIVKYNVDIDYWIDRSEQTNAALIVSAVNAASNDYVKWQRVKLGRDINPTELIYRCRAAGAKRVVVRSPAFTVTDHDEVAIADTISINYRGLEDD